MDDVNPLHPHRLGVKQLVSGGQAGADRAALDVALRVGIPHGGWVPAGRRAEDGPVASRYELTETPSADYAQRTEWNVRDSDATLIVSHGPLTGGSGMTWDFAHQYQKPVRHVDLSKDNPDEAAQSVREWILLHRPEVLNVAGPRTSTTAGTYEAVYDLLLRVFAMKD